MLTISALRRLAASSKEVRVRVLGSTKKLTRVLPCKAGTFLTSRVPTSLNASAVSSTSEISAADSSRRPNKSFLVQFSGALVILSLAAITRLHPVSDRYPQAELVHALVW